MASVVLVLLVLNGKSFIKRFSGVMCRAVALRCFGFSLGAFAQANTPSADAFLPAAGVTDAVYVQIERDPAFDDYVRRINQAREKNAQAIADYAREHAGKAPLPYTELFGVGKEDYERFSQPMNHYREVSRKEIKVRRAVQNGQIRLDFQGGEMLLTRVMLNPDGTASTQTDTNMVKQPFVDMEVASLPPGRHRGAHFRTPDARIGLTKRRESLLIGELKDSGSRIIHYSVNTPGHVKMAYIQFGK